MDKVPTKEELQVAVQMANNTLKPLLEALPGNMIGYVTIFDDGKGNLLIVSNAGDVSMLPKFLLYASRWVELNSQVLSFDNDATKAN